VPNVYLMRMVPGSRVSSFEVVVCSKDQALRILEKETVDGPVAWKRKLKRVVESYVREGFNVQLVPVECLDA